ncbi:MAG: hypothetical protein AAF798_18465 [Bacteroidota bacterium]
MNAWNTILRTSVTGISSAIATLEILGDKRSAIIFDCLQAYGSCSFLDLLVSTQFDSDNLEDLMDELCTTNVVLLESDVFGSRYRINQPRLNQILRLAGSLTEGL